MKRFNLLYISLLATVISSTLFAQMPSMKIQGEKNAQSSAVSLKSMDINVEIFGNVAVTTMKMVFHNNSSRTLEGELTFPMPEGVTVSRYAIDINNKLRDAVPVAKAKATEVFESIEHRRVDPGLLERVEGNNFRTRIYPLPANGERTVLIAYEETLTFKNGSAMQYHLPLSYQNNIPAFSLNTKIYQATNKPQLTEQPDGSFTFSKNNQLYEASMQKNNFKPTKALTINLPKETSIPEIVMQKNTDGSYYFLVNAYPKKNERKKTGSNHIGIIWDNSLSGLYRDKNKEMELLDKIIRQKQNLTIELGLLNIRFKKAKSFTIKNGDWSELRNYLQNLAYDGGTDFSQLNSTTLTADEYLLFSEGLSTFGQNIVRINKPVYCVSSSVKADYSALKAISTRTGGKFVNLTNTSVDEAFKLFNQSNLQFLGIEEQTLVSEVYPSIPTEVNSHISVAGIIRTASGEITLLFGRNGNVEVRQKVKLQPGNSDIKVNRVWAQKKIAEMDIQYEQNKEDIEQLGKQFGIVTRNTSLLVLEDIADYVRYEITPPDELLSEYNRLRKNEQVQKEARVNNLLERAIAMATDLKQWWNTDFKPQKRYPKPQKKEHNIEESVIYEEELQMMQVEEAEITTETSAYMDLADRRSESRTTEYAPPPPPAVLPSVQDELSIISDNMAIDMEYSVVEEGEFRKQNSSANKTIDSKTIRQTQTKQFGTIQIPKIQNDKEYIQRMNSAKDPYTEYIALRETYMGTPGFFFDVSNFFYDKKQNETGLLVLSSLAELELENAELFKTLAYKLKEKGEYTQELFITQKVKEWRPMDPQSHRDYALALQDNGKYQEALEHLYSILNASYSPEAANRDNGIEEIIVCEINNLVSSHKNKLKLNDINPAIIANLPVDIRVVINWNKNDTDIDLWVTDPNGEKCDYSHKRTSIGGRISDDFTQGYGPEQFLLKKAINGTYRVETNFFGEQQLTLSGPTTIMAEIYLYYADGKQERKVVTFQNGENGRETNGVLIGEFAFGEGKRLSEISESDYTDENNELIANDTNESCPEKKNIPYPWAIGLGCLGCCLIVFAKKNS